MLCSPRIIAVVIAVPNGIAVEGSGTVLVGAPLYPFGNGLSYSAFAYSGLTLPGAVQAGQLLPVDVTVTNNGTRAGDEVAEPWPTGCSHARIYSKDPIFWPIRVEIPSKTAKKAQSRAEFWHTMNLACHFPVSASVLCTAKRAPIPADRNLFRAGQRKHEQLLSSSASAKHPAYNTVQ